MADLQSAALATWLRRHIDCLPQAAIFVQARHLAEKIEVPARTADDSMRVADACQRRRNRAEQEHRPDLSTTGRRSL